MNTIAKLAALFSFLVGSLAFWTFFLKWLLSLYGMEPRAETFMAVAVLSIFPSLVAGIIMFKNELDL